MLPQPIDSFSVAKAPFPLATEPTSQHLVAVGKADRPASSDRG